MSLQMGQRLDLHAHPEPFSGHSMQVWWSSAQDVTAVCRVGCPNEPCGAMQPPAENFQNGRLCTMQLVRRGKSNKYRKSDVCTFCASDQGMYDSFEIHM
jgi:hypothetical protein